MISYWEQTAFLQKDLIVIGSGITGLSLAIEYLQKFPNHEVVILERGVFPSGATTRNAGFACFGSPSELLYDIQQEGLDKALELVEMRWKGLLQLLKRTGRQAIDFENFGGYELLYPDNQDIIEQLDFLNQHLFPIFQQKVFLDASHKISEFGFSGKVAKLAFTPLEGQIHSGKLAKTLIKIAKSMGCEILTGAKVIDIEEDNHLEKVTVQQVPYTNLIQFLGKEVVLCTNAFASQLVPELNVIPGRGQILVTQPIPNLPWKGTFHYDKGFIYFRNVGNRILIGGARNQFLEQEQTYSMETTDNVLQYLQEFLKTVVCPNFEIETEHAWAGTMGFGETKLPYLQKIRNHLYAAVKFSGMGVALASLAATQLMEMIEN